jgi:hypothetical protein
VRPSLRSTDSVSSVSPTFCARGLSISTAEVFIPALDQPSFIFLDEPPDPAELIPAESAAARKADRGEPKLRNVAIPFDVRVGRLIPIAGVKEESVRTETQNCWHALSKFTVFIALHHARATWHYSKRESFTPIQNRVSHSLSITFRAKSLKLLVFNNIPGMSHYSRFSQSQSFIINDIPGIYVLKLLTKNCGLRQRRPPVEHLRLQAQPCRC